MNAKSAWNSAKPYDWSNPKNTDQYYDVANPGAIDRPSPNNAAGSLMTPNATVNP